MGVSLNTSIRSIGLSVRTANALVKSGVKTVQDLLVRADLELLDVRGLGKTGLAEIVDFRDKLSVFTDDGQSIIYGDEDAESNIVSLGGFLQSVESNNRTVEIFQEYYNEGRKATLESIGNKYGITRERIRQLIKRGVKRLGDACDSGIIDESTIKAIDNAADNRVEISTINIQDEVFTSAGAARLVADLKPNLYKVVCGNQINGEWITKTEDNVQEMLSMLIDDLKYRPQPLSISDVETLYSIREDMLLSLVGIVEKEGYVTFKTNKIVLGQDRNRQVEDYLKEIGRPASIAEVLANTELTMNQARGVFQNKGGYINVGRNVYDFVDRDYDDYTVSDLAVNIITAENRALRIGDIVKYIQKYNDSSVEEIIQELVNSERIKNIDDYYLLDDWGEDKIEKKVRHSYTVVLEDAVFDIINSSDDIFNYLNMKEKIIEKYSENVSINETSIKATLVRLYNQGLISRVGENTGYYRRLKDLPDSYKDRKLSEIKNGDSAVSDWYSDILQCVDRLGDTFTLAQLYEFEDELFAKHPNNNNIQNKIRQQLQIMRDNGVVEMVTPGIYRKKL